MSLFHTGNDDACYTHENAADANPFDDRQVASGNPQHFPSQGTVPFRFPPIGCATFQFFSNCNRHIWRMPMEKADVIAV